MKLDKKYFIIIAVVFLVLLYSSLTIINTGITGVVMSFGKPTRVVEKSGILLTLPYPINKVETIDARLLMFQPKPSEFLTSDKKNLIMENSICYRIVDPILYMKTVRN